jgi:hypothetical protein
MISPAKVKCDYAIEKKNFNRIFNRKAKNRRNPSIYGGSEKQKKIATEQPSPLNRIRQLHFCKKKSKRRIPYVVKKKNRRFKRNDNLFPLKNIYRKYRLGSSPI